MPFEGNGGGGKTSVYEVELYENGSLVESSEPIKSADDMSGALLQTSQQTLEQLAAGGSPIIIKIKEQDSDGSPQIEVQTGEINCGAGTGRIAYGMICNLLRNIATTQAGNAV